MSDTQMFYKLVILYILEKVDFKMTSYQLCEYLIDNGYTNYFNFKEQLEKLLEIGLVEEEESNGKIFYSNTSEGKNMLDMFVESKISPNIQNEITSFLKEKGYEFKSDNQETCDINKNEFGNYYVHCSIKDNEESLLDLTISVPSKEQAIVSKEKWRKNKQEIYSDILKKLI